MATNARCGPVYFGDESKKIVLGDALTELRKLPSESVELIFADPPYSIGEDFDGMVESWDEEVFLAWLFECIDECHRILRPCGAMYIMNSTENMPYIDLKCRPFFTIKSHIVWLYDSPEAQAKNYFGSMYEPILMMVRDQKSYIFNRDDVLVEAKVGARRALIDYRRSPPQSYNQKGVLGNVREFPRVRYLMDEYENRPTQKPRALLERIILMSSNPNDKVLDPFTGGLAAGATAVELGRKFIGTEINTGYVKMGLRRLSIGSHFSEIELAKVRKRKIKNLSKKSRLTAKNGDFSTK